MCLSQGASSLATTALGGTGSAAASIYSAQSDKLGLNLAARIAEINASAMQDNAREALRQGGEAESRLRLEAGKLKSRQTVAQAANGVQLDSGSALNERVSTDYMTEVDANTLRQNAAREAAGYRVQATGYQNQALVGRAAASAISPFASGLASLATTASKVSSDWMAFNKAGVRVGFGKPKLAPLGSVDIGRMPGMASPVPNVSSLMLFD